MAKKRKEINDDDQLSMTYESWLYNAICDVIHKAQDAFGGKDLPEDKLLPLLRDAFFCVHERMPVIMTLLLKQIRANETAESFGNLTIDQYLANFEDCVAERNDGYEAPVAPTKKKCVKKPSAKKSTIKKSTSTKRSK